MGVKLLGAPHIDDYGKIGEALEISSQKITKKIKFR